MSLKGLKGITQALYGLRKFTMGFKRFRFRVYSTETVKFILMGLIGAKSKPGRNNGQLKFAIWQLKRSNLAVKTVQSKSGNKNGQICQ